jgi:membrane fusion protein (multidrug efflux system)
MLAFSATVLAAATVAACSTARSAQADGQASPQPVRMASATDATRPDTSVASGVVQAQTAVDVTFQVPGKVTAVGPDEGDVVRAGDFLAQIDSTDYRLAVEQAAAQAEHAARDRERYRPLLAAGSVSPSDFDRIEAAARQATAAADLSRKRLADSRLVAPLSGVVARRAVEPGATASPGQPVFTLMDVDPVRVRIGVPESEIGRIRVGQRADVRLPALPDEFFAGRVTLVGIAADAATRTYAVEISVPNPARRLKVGMVAEARVPIDRQLRAISVPADAVVRDATDSTLLYVLDESGSHARARRVEIGAVRGGAIEIVRGIAAGELVIVAGQQRLHDGSSVILVPARGNAQAGAGGSQ